MPVSVTPTAQYGTSLQIPADLEACNSASVLLFAQTFADRAALALETRKMIGPLPRSVYCANGTDLKIDPIRGIMVTSSSVWRYVDISSTGTVTVANLEGGGNFVSGTWYYVYVYYNAGSPAYQISTTAPDSYLLFKNGSTDYAYLCAFVGISATGIPVFNMSRGYYQYATALSPTISVVSAVNPTVGNTDVSLATVIPPHAKFADLWVSLENNGTAATECGLTVTNKDHTGVSYFKANFVAAKSTANDNTWATGHLRTTFDSSRRITYNFYGTTADCTLYITLHGWME